MQVRILLLLLLLTINTHLQFFKTNIRSSSNSYWFYHLNNLNSLSWVYFFLYWCPSLKNYKYQSYSNTNYNIYFIRKEHYYTKLKYSRVPQFDTSSGASASFMSGFYGYLICEKCGFELIDSADFLFFILYLIVLSLALIQFSRMLNSSTFVSPYIYNFFYSLVKK